MKYVNLLPCFQGHLTGFYGSHDLAFLSRDKGQKEVNRVHRTRGPGNRPMTSDALGDLWQSKRVHTPIWPTTYLAAGGPGTKVLI